MTKKPILFAKPSITSREVEYVTDAIANGWAEQCYTYLGKYREKLKQYFDVPYAWPTSSCHGALHIILMALGVGPGDEVIVPDMTWIGSVSPISWLGAKPVFVDVQKDSWCLDPDLAEKAITEHTKAIIVVHPYGNVADISRINDIGKRHNIPVIEDAAESVGSEYHGRKVGGISELGVISTHGTKMLTTGEGGAILCRRADLVDKITVIENQGRLPKKQIHFWVDELGLKYKMANIQAALGLAQFERADEIVAKKREIFAWYRDRLEGLRDVALNPEPPDTLNSYWQPTIVFGDSWPLTIDGRTALIDKLNAEQIALRPIFFPVSMFPMYVSCPSNTISYSLYQRGFNLPSYFEMDEADVDRVVDRLLAGMSELQQYGG